MDLDLYEQYIILTVLTSVAELCCCFCQLNHTISALELEWTVLLSLRETCYFNISTCIIIVYHVPMC